MALQADGKIVRAGGPDSGKIEVIRYLANGTPDLTFSGDGMAKLTVPGTPNPFINSVAFSRTERSSWPEQTDPEQRLPPRARHRGRRVDPTFGANGMMATDIFNNGIDRVYEVLCPTRRQTSQPGNYGSTRRIPTSPQSASHDTTDGSLDASFIGPEAARRAGRQGELLGHGTAERRQAGPGWRHLHLRRQRLRFPRCASPA
jgi:hypothetical protein